jgi:hypothetical protein
VPSTGSSSFSNASLIVDKTIERIERLNLVLLGTATLASWGTGIGHVPSLLLGGGVMHANFWLLKKTVRRLLARPEDGSRGKMRAGLLFLAKAGLLLFLLSLLFTRYAIHGESFACGVSLLLAACVIVSLSKPRYGG